jgi:hypothetical protein
MQRFLELLGPRPCTTTDALARLVRLDQFRAEMFAFWQSYDAMICPACAVPAIQQGTSWANASVFSYTMAYNLTGWPCAEVRAGTSPDGLPIGVQIVARPWREDVALAVARKIEVAFGGWQPQRGAVCATWHESSAVRRPPVSKLVRTAAGVPKVVGPRIGAYQAHQAGAGYARTN